MTDKHPKDMIASELLRLADSHPCSMCHLVMTGDESCATTGCASWAYRLADKIDAELAQARELSLRAGAELWAKANGWPDFRDGEDFGAWLDRCAIPRPRYEDGEPVQFDYDTDELNGIEKFIFLRSGGGCCQMQDADGNICNVYPGERVKRPAPEVLGADGKPIVVGETVYLANDGIEGTVKELLVDKRAYIEWCDGTFTPGVLCKNLTHTPPDTQERIDEGKKKLMYEYWECKSSKCGECPATIDGKKPSLYYGVRSCSTAQGMDIASRQHELDKRTGGAE